MMLANKYRVAATPCHMAKSCPGPTPGSLDATISGLINHSDNTNKLTLVNTSRLSTVASGLNEPLALYGTSKNPAQIKLSQVSA
jgi:hypothetical protein